MGRKSLEQIIKTVGLVAGAVVGCVTGGYFGYVSGTVNIENAEEYFSALKSVIPYYPAVAAAWLAILGGIIGYSLAEDLSKLFRGYNQSNGA